MESELFSFDERVGILFTVEGAFLSIASVAFILALAGYRWLKRVWARMSDKGSGEVESSDAADSTLFLNLMFADLIQAIGILPNIRWMHEGKVTQGSACVAQAVLKQVGIVGVSMTSLAIAVHTFLVLVLRWKDPHNSPRFLVIAVWVATAIIVGIPNAVHREGYYTPVGYWCWIPTTFKTEEIVTEYLWVWIAGVAMIILYGIMFGVIMLSTSKSLSRLSEEEQAALQLEESDEDKKTKAIAYSLLFYPIVYLFFIFPNTLSRWLFFSNKPIPFQFALFANTIYGMSGMFTLILYLFTRRDVVLGRKQPQDLPDSDRHRSKQRRPTRDDGYLPPDIVYGDEDPEKDSTNLKTPTSIVSRQEYATSPSTIYQAPKGLMPNYGVSQRHSAGPSISSKGEDEEELGHLPF